MDEAEGTGMKRVAFFGLALVVGAVLAGPAQAAPPNASFTVSPANPVVGQTVTLDASASSDPDSDPLTYAWNFSGSAFDDATGPVVTITYGSPGVKTVGLQVTAGGETSTTSRSFTVSAPPNRAPTADFRVHPREPKAGELIELDSISTDPDDAIVSQLWDLNGDGAYNEASGEFAFSRLPEGRTVLGLRVQDARGAVAVKRVLVNATPAEPELMNPFPVVRIVGGLTRRGARIRRLAVVAPVDARIVVRCRGRRCPLRRLSARGRGSGASVRFRRLQRRLQAGVVLEVSVTGRGSIGKFTRFRIRRGRAPKRTDACLRPGSTSPSRCPTR